MAKGYFTYVLIAMTITPLAQAQASTTALSNCAIECMQRFIIPSGCEATDISCLCTSERYTGSVQTCLQANCTVRQSLTAKRFQAETCHAPVRNEGDFTRRACWTLSAFAIFAVAARYVFRNSRFKGSGYGIDDYTILLSLMLLMPLQACIDIIIQSGLGQDIWFVKFENIDRLLYFFWIGEYLYLWIMTTTRISIVMLYLRIWSHDRTMGAHDWFRTCCFALIGFLTIFAVIMSITLGFECNPISYAWLRWDNEHTGTCINLQAQVYSLAAINIVQDIIVIFLPFPKVVYLNLSWRKKIAVCGIFLVGLFVTACSIIRLQYLVQYGHTTNPTWSYNAIVLWSDVECTIAIVCACLPSMAGLLQRLYRYGMGSFGSDANRSNTFGYGSTGARTQISRPVPQEQWDQVRMEELGSLGSKAIDSNQRSGTLPSYDRSVMQYTRPVAEWE